MNQRKTNRNNATGFCHGLSGTFKALHRGYYFIGGVKATNIFGEHQSRKQAKLTARGPRTGTGLETGSGVSSQWGAKSRIKTS